MRPWARTRGRSDLAGVGSWVVGRGSWVSRVLHSSFSSLHTQYSYSTSTCRHCILALPSSLSSVINHMLYFNRMKK